MGEYDAQKYLATETRASRRRQGVWDVPGGGGAGGGKAGRKPSHTAMLGLEPGDEFEIKLGESRTGWCRWLERKSEERSGG